MCHPSNGRDGYRTWESARESVNLASCERKVFGSAGQRIPDQERDLQVHEEVSDRQVRTQEVCMLPQRLGEQCDDDEEVASESEGSDQSINDGDEDMLSTGRRRESEPVCVGDGEDVRTCHLMPCNKRIVVLYHCIFLCGFFCWEDLLWVEKGNSKPPNIWQISFSFLVKDFGMFDRAGRERERVFLLLPCRATEVRSLAQYAQIRHRQA